MYFPIASFYKELEKKSIRPLAVIDGLLDSLKGEKLSESWNTGLKSRCVGILGNTVNWYKRMLV